MFILEIKKDQMTKDKWGKLSVGVITLYYVMDMNVVI